MLSACWRATDALSWLTQEDNQFLSVPREFARLMPTCLLDLLGFSRVAGSMGYVDAMRDPKDQLQVGDDYRVEEEALLVDWASPLKLQASAVVAAIQPGLVYGDPRWLRPKL